MILYVLFVVVIVPAFYCAGTDGSSTALIVAWGIGGIFNFCGFMATLLVDGWTSKTWAGFTICAAAVLLIKITPYGVPIL